jgi:cytochrome c oxidase subunit 1
MSDYSLPVSSVIDTGTSASERGTFLERLHGWVVTVDHKRLGILYILYSTFFLLVAGAEALFIRLQLAYPHNHVLSAQVFNRFFTMHGTTMVFLVGMPFLFGFANYIVPLQIGARDMAFPRLNAFSFWLTAFGGFLLYYSFLGGAGLYGMGNAPDVGWFAYAPLTARSFSPGHATDYWALALIVSGFGTLGTAINIVATVISMRCKGMTLMRMPLFTWLLLVVSMLTLVTITPLTAAQFMLLIDRYLGGHFFDTQAGGSSLIWIHFFWIFGHPEVYVFVMPAFAIDRQRDYPGVVPQSHLWLSINVCSFRGNHVRQSQCVGAPHVHRRHDLGFERLLHVIDDAGRRPNRDQDLQLDRHSMGWPDTFHNSDAVLHWILVPVPHCRAYRHHALGVSMGLATP